MKTKIKAEIVADSLSPQGDRLTSLLITFPRILLSEINTHRMLSKNTSSSRAIPFNKMVEAVQKNPFIPIAWQKDHKGMQGTEYLNPNKKYIWGDFYEYLHEQFKKAFYDEENEKWKEEYDEFQQLFNSDVIPIFTHKHEGYTPVEWWLKTRDLVVSASLMLYGMGVTKQLCNRLLEPFMWTTILITGSKESWDNFFNLRCPQYGGKDVKNNEIYFKSKREAIKHLQGLGVNTINLKEDDILGWLQINKGQAEIHMMALAEEIYDAYNGSIPKELKEGEWHIPFGDKIDDDEILQKTAKKEEVSHLETAYDIYQYYAIKVSTARCARLSYMTFERKIDYEKDIDLHDQLLASHHMSPFEHCARAMSEEEYDSYYKGVLPEFSNIYNSGEYGWCNNFKGFIQYRYMIEHGLI